jgi:NTE family protein
VGLVLSGGGIRGVAHLGVIQALSERGIEFSHISGTSAGAIAGAFTAAGYTAKEVLKIITNTRLLRYLRPGISSSGLLSMHQAELLYRKYIPHNSFEKLKIPLIIAVVDFGEAKVTYLNHGALAKAICASSSIPGIFRPVVINEKMYVDGGLLNNFPIEPLIGSCDFIIGSSCNNLPVINKVTSFTQLIERSSAMAISMNVNGKPSLCQAFIEPLNLGSYSVFDTRFAEEIFWIGYEETLKTIATNEGLQALIKHKNLPNLK